MRTLAPSVPEPAASTTREREVRYALLPGPAQYRVGRPRDYTRNPTRPAQELPNGFLWALSLVLGLSRVKTLLQ